MPSYQKILLHITSMPQSEGNPSKVNEKGEAKMQSFLRDKTIWKKRNNLQRSFSEKRAKTKVQQEL